VGGTEGEERRTYYLNLCIEKEGNLERIPLCSKGKKKTDEKHEIVGGEKVVLIRIDWFLEFGNVHGERLHRSAGEYKNNGKAV